MKKLSAAIVFVLMAALAVFAIQNPAPPSPNPPQQSGTMGQAPAQPTNPTAPLPQGQPDTPAPQVQTQPPAQGAPPSIDDQVKILATQLNLNDQQQGKIKNVLQDQHDQAMTVVRDTSLSREQKLDKIHSLRQSTISRVRETLSDDQQRQKFDAMIQAQDQRMREREQQQPEASPRSPK